MGSRVFKRLAEGADVVVENFRPEVKRRLGIDYEALSAINPRVVYASISGFGQSGPYRDRPGFDQIAQGMGGLMSITGLPGQGPVRVGVPISDLAAGLLCASGILTALLEREVSSKGQWLHTSLLEAQIFMLDFQAARFLVDGEVPEQAGNDHPTRIPMGVFETADGHINIGASGETIWRRLCEAIGAEELLIDPHYADAASRSRNRAALNTEINRRLGCADSATWIQRLNEAGVPCGPINRIDQVFADPQVRHLGIARGGRFAGSWADQSRRSGGHAQPHTRRAGGALAGMRRTQRRDTCRVRLHRLGYQGPPRTQRYLSDAPSDPHSI